MLKIRLPRISLRDLVAIGLPALAITIAAFWIAALFIKPAPPKTLVMSTGAETGAYHAFGKRYQEILARNGIELELRPSAGSAENFQRLVDMNSAVTVAFLQAGTGNAEDGSELEMLSSVFYEPLWVFYRDHRTLDRVRDLAGKRLAVGAPGSGTRSLAMRVLVANGTAKPPTKTLDLGADDAAKALIERRVDAAFIVGAAELPSVRKLLFEPGVKLLSFNRAAAYTRLFPYLHSVTLPQGSIDLIRDIPARDTLLLAPTANLVAHDSIHPAHVDLLMQAIAEVHGQPGVLHKAGEFPAVKDVTFPESAEAKRFFKSGTPFLQRYLPFWAATLLDRLFVLLVPIIAVLLPLIRIGPPLYGWRVRSRIFRWYAELKLIELEIKDALDPAQRATLLGKLDELEQRALKRPVPLSYSDLLYNLRSHIELMRSMLARSAAATAASPAPEPAAGA